MTIVNDANKCDCLQITCVPITAINISIEKNTSYYLIFKYNADLMNVHFDVIIHFEESKYI